MLSLLPPHYPLLHHLPPCSHVTTQGEVASTEEAPKEVLRRAVASSMEGAAREARHRAGRGMGLTL